MTTTETTARVQAPHWIGGVKLGLHDGTVIGVLGERTYLVRFDDGHETPVLRSELLANARDWALIDFMTKQLPTLDERIEAQEFVEFVESSRTGWPSL